LEIGGLFSERANDLQQNLSGSDYLLLEKVSGLRDNVIKNNAKG
jgi:hypothetical protein